MAKLFNRAKMTTSTTGSGTVTLSAAAGGFQSFADAGVSNGDVVQYLIEEGSAWEIGTGTYSSTGTSLTRTPSESSDGGTAITLAGAANVAITAVADDLNRLQHEGSTKVSVSATGASVTGALTTSGDLTVNGEMGADLSFGDNTKAKFGAGDDLQIYHDGSSSKIVETGTGSLQLGGTSSVDILSGDLGEYLARFHDDGSVELRYDNAIKLQTTSTGIDVTGTVTADALTVSGDAVFTPDNDGVRITGANYATLRLEENDTTDLNTTMFNSSGDFSLYTSSDDRATLTQRLNIDHSTGDISFYEDTGTTAKLFWDASAESLGIGTTSPNYDLTVGTAGTTANSYIQIGSTTTGTGNLFFGDTTGTGAGSYSGYLQYNHNVDAMVFGTGGGAEKMRIDNSGNLLVGTTTVPATSNTNGFRVDESGYISLTGAGTSAIDANRSSSDGDIVTFRKDGSVVGTIGAKSDDLYINTGDTGLRFNDGNDQIWPVSSSGTSRDAAIDLGNSGVRFKDLYLSGEVNANTLDIDVNSAGSRRFIANYDDTRVTIKSGNASNNPETLQIIASPIVFRTGSSGSGTERMRIDSSGNLLVGKTSADGGVNGFEARSAGETYITATSATPLAVKRKTSDGTLVSFSKDSTTVGSIASQFGTGLKIDTQGTLQLESGSNNRYLYLDFDDTTPNFYPNPDDTLSIGRTNRRFKDAHLSGTVNTANLYASGNIGKDSGDYIKFTTDTRLDVYVNGSNEFRFESDGDFHADGNVIAYSTTISDERLKTDIKRIDGALDKICALSGYTFTYKHDGKASAGVVAQEVEKVLPSAVIEKELAFQGDDEAYKIVQYDQLHGLLIEAIKEQQEQINELKALLEAK